MARVVKVAVERTAEGLNRLFSYRVPDHWEEPDLVGYRVRAPLGRGEVDAVVLAQDDVSDDGDWEKLKTVIAVLDPFPVLTPSLIDIALWMQTRYLAYMGQIMRTMIPPAVRRGVRPSEPEARLRAGGEPPARAPVRMQIWEAVRAAGELSRSQILTRFPNRSALLRQMRELGELIAVEPSSQRPAGVMGPRLNAWQEQALSQIRSVEGTFLIEGVTGSGKTEVYLHLIDDALAQDRQALVLVPEIALTAQTVSRFRERLGDTVAVWHSGLADGERAAIWHAVRRGTLAVVVGARSAVFLPFPRLGLIVLDEEHESTYKQEEFPHYHAREVAERRGRNEGARVLLGSATPSLESAYRAREGEIGWCVLPVRVTKRPLPSVSMVDMRAELEQGNREMFSRELKGALDQVLERGEQAILLLNRRGFATFIFCRACGNALKCPHCSVTLTFHAGQNRLQCHYCFTQVSPPVRCPHCGSPQIRYFGAGTEKLAAEVSRFWPTARVARADRDVMTVRNSYERLYRAMRDGEVDILVGTQMIAKGMDWPRVTLVGVLAADSSLHFPDFRSGERTFQLLVQAAGRAGRGENPGTVVIQTYSPEHYALTSAVRQDFESLYRDETAFRREAGYPPFSHLWLVEMQGEEESEVRARAENAAASLRDRLVGAEVLGPAPAPISRVRGKWRFHILIKAVEPEALTAELGSILSAFSPVRVTVDPYFML